MQLPETVVFALGLGPWGKRRGNGTLRPVTFEYTPGAPRQMLNELHLTVWGNDLRSSSQFIPRSPSPAVGGAAHRSFQPTGESARLWEPFFWRSNIMEGNSGA